MIKVTVSGPTGSGISFKLLDELKDLMEKHSKPYKIFGPEDNSELFESVRQWGRDKGIVFEGNETRQMLKTVEELGELASALSKNKPEEIRDAYGDIIVTVIVGAACRGINAEDCLQEAYDVIAKRTGKSVNGTFVKDES